MKVRVVMNDDDPVPGCVDVQLDCVGSTLEGALECGNGVLGKLPLGVVGQDQDGPTTAYPAQANRRKLRSKGQFAQNHHL